MTLWRPPSRWLSIGEALEAWEPRRRADSSYALPPAEEKTEILRVVVRESMSGDLLSKLIHDIIAVAEMLLADAGPSPSMSVMDHIDHIDKAVRARPGHARHAHTKRTGQGAKGKKAGYIC